MLELLLHLIHLLCKLPKNDEQTYDFKKEVHRLMKLDIRGPSSRSILHMALDKKTSSVSDEFYSNFPSLEMIQLLLECGARVNSSDEDGNTPLHVAAENILLQQDDKVGKEMAKVIQELLNAHAHIDARNNEGQMAGTNLSTVWFKIKLLNHVSLKCLAARVIKEHKIPYKGEVPVSLIPFIEMH